LKKTKYQPDISRSMEKYNLNNKTSADYGEFSLVSGGLIYMLTSFIRKKARKGRILTSTALVMVLITWVPMCLLALYEGTLNDNETTISFFEDFLVHVRFLLIVPFLILIENMVDRTFVAYVRNSDLIIPTNQQLKFNKLVKQLDKLTNSYLPEILVLILHFTGFFLGWYESTITESQRNYITSEATGKLNIAGWYYFLICLPIFYLLVSRWLWRWIVWMYSMFRINRFKLYLDPLHADQMAGLEYLNLVPLTFSFILVAPSAMLSAVIGIDIIYHGASFSSYYIPILIYVFLLPIILYSPLLIFIPKLIHAKNEGIFKFGRLIRKHNSDYVEKWIDGEPPKNETILGAMDNSSLADINGSYAPIQSIKLIPIDIKMILVSFILNVIPYIPLVFTYYSLNDLFEIFARTIAN